MDDVTTTIGIDAQVLNNTSTGMMNNGSGNVFSFSADNSVTYASPYGFSVDTPSTMMFVSTTIAYDSDIFEVKTAFDTGAQLTSVSNLSQGDVLVYKTDRMVDVDGTSVSKVFYGILEVQEIILVNGTDESVNFKYNEGIIIGQ